MAYAIGEIEHFAFGEIKSVPQPDEVGFHREAISPERSEDFSRPKGRISLKKALRFREVLFSVKDVLKGTDQKEE